MTDQKTSTPRQRPFARVYRSDVRAARRRLAGRIRRTPVFHTTVSGPGGPVPVTLKLEHLQHGGTFKARGSFNALLESGEGTDHVVIASGGNAGIAAALAAAALGKTCTVEVEVSSIAADALGASRIGDIAFDIARRYDVGSVLVSDDAIADAREYLWREFRLVVELAGATALAAIRSGAYVPAAGERPVVVLCGANTDLTTF
ncbi:pyridoxal-phosphate dependent enzyme [Nocardia cyriacigeorgica]|uniref:pyridoxal-phosphate dependent enzyme n=1 Tax=Nocardia cyriacigeorgica TaxID=135487 RepID=UPI0024573039|nr:pyridoxal-phosphate dependent enzyme [Nocardia cyriacigeorgica]